MIQPRTILLFLALCAVPQTASADPDPLRKFADAQAYYDRGDFAGALVLFQQAYKESASPNARLYMARSLRELGQVTKAYREMDATYRDAAQKALAEEKYALTRDAAAAELTLLTDRVARFMVVLDATAQGATVTANGTTLPAGDLGVVVPHSPERMRFVATLPDQESKVHEVDLRAGTLSVVAINFPPPAPPEPEAQPASVSLLTLGVITSAVGLAGGAVFVGAGVASDGKFDNISSACEGTRCTDPSQADAIDEGKQLQLAANIGLGVGIAGLAVGATLLTVGATSDSAPVSARITPTGASMRIAF